MDQCIYHKSRYKENICLVWSEIYCKMKFLTATKPGKFFCRSTSIWIRFLIVKIFSNISDSSICRRNVWTAHAVREALLYLTPNSLCRRPEGQRRQVESGEESEFTKTGQKDLNRSRDTI